MANEDGTLIHIRQAALRLFASRGFEATGIRDVARDAGISTASLYHYMGSKDDLLLDIIRTAMHELRADGLAAVRDGATPTERIANLVRSHVRFHGRNQLEALVSDGELRSLSEPTRKSVIHLRDEYEGLWTTAISDGIASGELSVEDPSVARLALLQMCTGVAYWYSPAGRLSLSALADQFTDLALAMLGSRDPHGAGPAPTATAEQPS